MPERYYQARDCSTGTCYPTQVIDGGAVYHDMRMQYQQDCRRGTCPPRVRDGGGPVYRNSDMPPTMNEQQYEQTLERTFGKEHRVTDKNNYRENLWGAAEKQKPVVMVFGRSGDPGNQAVLDSVARAKEKANGAAEFVYVDLNKVDPKSRIGEYSKYIGKDYGTPLTMVFTQKQGEQPYPVVPERPLHWQRGSHLDENALLAGITKAAEIQKGREIKTGREKPPEVPVAPESDKVVDNKPAEKSKATAQDLINESIKPWKDQKINEMFKGLSPEERTKLAWDAINTADKQNNLQLSAQIRALVGLASFEWGAEAQAAGRKDEAEQHFLRGSEYILSAGVYNKNIYKYPGFAQALTESKLPGRAAELLLQKGIQDVDRPMNQKPWFYPNEKETANQNPNAFQDARDRYTALLKEEMAKPKTVTPPRDARPVRR